MTDEFDDAGFWAKLQRYARAAGRQVVEKSLWLYYAAEAPDTPGWAKSTIYGALAYFVLPLDAIPDLLPAVGYTDDLWMLAAAVASVSLYIDSDVRRKSDAKLAAWFGPPGEADAEDAEDAA